MSKASWRGLELGGAGGRHGKRVTCVPPPEGCCPGRGGGGGVWRVAGRLNGCCGDSVILENISLVVLEPEVGAYPS